MSSLLRLAGLVNGAKGVIGFCVVLGWLEYVPRELVETRPFDIGLPGKDRPVFVKGDGSVRLRI
jgi:hypothetical protein